MRIDLSGQRAIVTGSSKGIGLAIAKGLAEAGASVLVNGRDATAVDAAVAAIRGKGGEADGVVADVGTRAGCDAVVARWPDTDVLVNNVAVIGWGAFENTSDETWLEIWETNVMSGARLSRHYLPGMIARGWGRLLFVSSESARNVQPDLIPYGASKLALHALSRGLARQAAGSGVTSNVVVPGPTLSDGANGMLQPSVDAGQAASLEDAGAGFVKAYRGSSMLGRMASVDEVAAMAVYLASPLASATTGAVLRVDGGVVEDVN